MKKLLVVLLVLGLASPAMAVSQWYWYGSARINTGYINNSQELRAWAGGQAANSIPGIDNTIMPSGTQSGGVDDSGTVLGLNLSSRLGAKVVASDAISGQVEFRLINADTNWRLGAVYPGDPDATVYAYKGPYFRQLYGQWKFGAGNLRVGQDYTPATFLLYSNSIGDSALGGDELGLTGGLPYVSSQPLIKLTLGGFQAAITEAYRSNNYDRSLTLTGGQGSSYDLASRTATATVSDIDYNLPRIELAYQWNTPMISLRPILGYQTYDAVVRNGASEDAKSITSYVYGLGSMMRFGPAYVNLAIAGNQNGGNYGFWQTNTSKTNRASIDANGNVKDSTGLQAMAVVGATINSMLAIEAGYAYNKTEGEIWLYGKNENTWQQYYIQLPITAAQGVIFTPEFGVFDYGDNEVKSTGAVYDAIAAAYGTGYANATAYAVGAKEKLGTSTYFLIQARIDF